MSQFIALFRAGFIATLLCSTGFAATIRVPGDSASVQTGINGAIDGDTVLVADGTYREHVTVDSKSLTLMSENGRDYTSIYSDTSRSITITGSPAITIDGFAFTGISSTPGGAIYLDSSSVVVKNSSIINSVANAGYGGGICSINSDLTLLNDLITNNQVDVQGGPALGGGVYSTGRLIVDSQCVISHNVVFSCGQACESPIAWSYGGGIYCEGDSILIRNSTISSNLCWWCLVVGGGIYLSGDSFLIENCIIDSNRVSGSGCKYSGDYARGGGLYVAGDNGMIIGNEVKFNVASGPHNAEGGGLFLSGNENVVISNTIHDDTVYSYAWDWEGGQGITFSIGGGCYLAGNNDFFNNVVLRNSAISRVTDDIYPYPIMSESKGGGCYIVRGDTVSGNTFVDNLDSALIVGASPGEDSLMPVSSGAGCYIDTTNYFGRNVIAFNRSFASCENLDDSVACPENREGAGVYIVASPSGCNVYFGNIGHSEWYGDCSVTDSNAHPRFCDIANEDFHLAANSPCAPGNNVCGVLIGALGVECPDVFLVWHVDTAGNDSTGDGSQGNPFGTIQHAIDQALSGDTVLVENGTYFENINFNGKGILIGSNHIFSSDTLDIRNTMIDGNAANPVVTFESSEDRTSVLTGLTIQHGKGLNWPGYWAGGINCNNSSSPTIAYNIIKDNDSQTDGCGGINCSFGSSPLIIGNRIISNSGQFYAGGIHCETGSDPQIIGNIITENVGSMYGGGVSTNMSSPLISGNEISRNRVNSLGGGICTWGSAAIIENNNILSNISDGFGGGICCWLGSKATIRGNTIASDSANNGGGIFCDYNCNPAITNNTLESNVAANYGGGLYCAGGGITSISNSIFWDNISPVGPQIFLYQGAEVDITCSDLQDTIWLGFGNISTDPLFCDAAGGDFHIDSLSPCAPYHPLNECGVLIGALGPACQNCHDSDNDGICDDVDNCPTVSNENQQNSDNDSLGNACDNCPYDDNDDQADGDSDNAGNVCDNCPTVSNENQADGDGDSVGDVCDNCPTVSNENQADTDSDNVGDVCDNCPAVYNPGQEDSNGDGVGDACSEGGSLLLDHVGGSGPGNLIGTDAPITFYIRLINVSGFNILGITNGFRVYSPEMAQWSMTLGEFTGAITPGMLEHTFINTYGITGSGADTVGFGGYTVPPGLGIPSGFADVTYAITIGPIDPSYDGSTICFDSSFYPPVNTWMWNVSELGDFFPSWDGPHCFTISADFDGDGIANNIDNCPTVYNPTQTDQDEDGLGDVCDECTDTDGDGYGNPGYAANTCPDDNCPDDYNPDQANSDTDSLGNACDNCPDDDNDDQADGDSDGVGDVCDNCPNVSNADQSDIDGDNAGDVCDECTDTDGDGYGNPGYAANTCPDDNCPDDYNPGQEDTDNDGIGDACCCVGIRGNVDGNPNDEMNISDLLYFVEYSFGDPQGPEPPCPDEADVDGSGVIDIADILYMVEYMFGSPTGPAPVECP